MRLLLVLLLAVAPRSATAPELKSVFLFNFAQFVEWPEAAYPDSKADFVIGVLGQDPLGMVLDDIVKGEHLKEHPIVVTRFHTVEEIRACHILYFGDGAEDYGKIFTALKGRPILTVGDKEGFANSGGMVRFYDDAGRIRLRVNLDAATEAKLKISSQLLRAAQIVGR